MDQRRRGGHVGRYEALASNSLLFALDLVKEQLDAAYRPHGERAMRLAVDGIVSHAGHAISSGKVEGANNRVKTTRRRGYGCPDGECFFLKTIDSSGKRYVENPKPIDLVTDP